MCISSHYLCLNCSCLTMANLVHRTIIINVNVQPLGVVVHSLHAVGLKNAVLLGEIGLCESLPCTVSAFYYFSRYWKWAKLTVSSCCSPSFLPMSLFIQSLPEEPPSLDMMPGTTRGMVRVRVVVRARLQRWGRIVDGVALIVDLGVNNMEGWCAVFM
jgi:hypothetical protein